MKNYFKKLAAMAAVGFLTTSALAQYDYYAQPAWLNIAPVQILPEVLTTTLVTTNGVADMKMFDGVAAMYVNLQAVFSTNWAGAAATGAVWAITSPNGISNWVYLSNYSVATAATYYYTNYYGTSNNQFTITTNNYFTPGVVTTAVPGTAGFAGQYYVQNPFTNYGPIATGITNANYLVGFNTADQNRFLGLVFVVGGNTNVYWTGSGVLVGRRSNPRYY